MSKGKPSEDPNGSRDPFAERSLAEKSDAMARAYTAGRENRVRGERSRRAKADIAGDGVDGALASRKDRKGFEDEPSGALRNAEGRRRNRADEDEPADEKMKTPPPRRRALPRNDREPVPRRAEPLQNPFPQVDKKPPSGSPIRENSQRDLLAMEVDDLLRDIKQGWRNAGHADRVTWTAAILMMIGVFLPWVSDPAHTRQLGIATGGFLHLGIASLACYLVWRGTPTSIRRQGGLSPRDRIRQHRRSSLWLVLLGALSTLVGAYFVVLWGLQKDADANWWVELHFGLYWTLAAGTGLSYGGYRRFARKASPG